MSNNEARLSRIRDLIATHRVPLDRQWEIYRYLHQHPELSMQEERTLGIIKDKLSELGFQQN